MCVCLCARGARLCYRLLLFASYKSLDTLALVRRVVRVGCANALDDDDDVATDAGTLRVLADVCVCVCAWRTVGWCFCLCLLCCLCLGDVCCVLVHSLCVCRHGPFALLTRRSRCSHFARPIIFLFLCKQLRHTHASHARTLDVCFTRLTAAGLVAVCEVSSRSQ